MSKRVEKLTSKQVDKVRGIFSANSLSLSDISDITFQQSFLFVKKQLSLPIELKTEKYVFANQYQSVNIR